MSITPGPDTPDWSRSGLLGTVAEHIIVPQNVLIPCSGATSLLVQTFRDFTPQPAAYFGVQGTVNGTEFSGIDWYQLQPTPPIVIDSNHSTLMPGTYLIPCVGYLAVQLEFTIGTGGRYHFSAMLIDQVLRPALLGRQVMQSSYPVTLASDQAPIAVTPAADSKVNLDQWAGGVPPSVDALGGIAAAAVKVRDAGSGNLLSVGPFNNAWATLRDNGSGAYQGIDAGGAALTRPRIYDQMGTVFPAIGVQASMSFAAVAGKRWVLHFACFTLVNIASPAVEVATQVFDGGTAIDQDDLFITATVGDHDRIVITGAAMPSSVGNQLGVQLSAGPANTRGTVSAGVYQQ